MYVRKHCFFMCVCVLVMFDMLLQVAEQRTSSLSSFHSIRSMSESLAPPSIAAFFHAVDNTLYNAMRRLDSTTE